MALKRIDENPSISDTVLFDIITTDVNGCDIDPRTLDSITIYFLERGFDSNAVPQEYNLTVGADSLITQYNTLQQLYCESPSEDLQFQMTALQAQIVANAVNEISYYQNAATVQTYGDVDDPVWALGMSNPGEGNPGSSGYSVSHWPILHINQDANGNVQYGQFELQWTPNGQREGDYFICWSWTPVEYTSLSAHCVFSLEGDPKVTTTLPTHYTQPGKYETLLERYLPEMFKQYISANDLTPEVLEQFHQAIADGFTVLENLNNQLLDVINANVVSEAFLPWLANLFGLILRSQDPTRWRRQIKTAVPLYKKKGTLKGLREALAQAGIYLTSFNQLWQTISPYVWQESFTVTSTAPTFTLSKTLVGISSLYSYLNFGLYYRAANSTTWQILADCGQSMGTVTINNFFNPINTNNGVTTITWSTYQQEISLHTTYPVNPGDEIRILYQIADVSYPAGQAIASYYTGGPSTLGFTQGLPLMDQRYAAYGTYPSQNWNVRLIADNDPMFSNIVQVRNPWNEFVVFGQVRTEFAYSENIYNMDEFDGSTRDSTNPCHINKDFIDPCSGGLSSFYNIALEFDQLSDPRIKEAQEIIQEYTPFHSSVFNLETNGVVNDFIMSPVEQIDTLINYLGMETMIVNAQLIFNRVMDEGDILSQTATGETLMASALRNNLATKNAVATGTALIQNQSITIFCRDSSFCGLPLHSGDTTILEILSGVYAGTSGLSLNLTAIDPIIGHMAMIQGLSDSSGLNISPFIFRLSKDVYSYHNATITTYSGISGYSNAATVNLSSDGSLGNMLNLFKVGDYVFYNGIQYPILQLWVAEHILVIGNYSLGDAAGVNIHVYDRLLDNQTGNFNYYGTILTTSTNYETSLPIVNGANGVNPSLIPVPDTSQFKENFLIEINNNLFEIAQINGTQITLAGPQLAWSLTGQNINFTIFQYVKVPVNIPEKYIHPWPGYDFEFVDRGGNNANDIVEYTIDNIGLDSTFAPMNAINNNQAIDITGIKESISFKIQWSEEEVQ